MCIVDSWSDAVSHENSDQSHQISSNLKVTSNDMVSRMTHPYIIITDENLHLKLKVV